jgi:hypothetical protein
MSAGMSRSCRAPSRFLIYFTPRRAPTQVCGQKTQLLSSFSMQRTNSSPTAVLATTELLELILLFLPTLDLIRAQRVSRSFRNTIIHSQSLQEVLFLRPNIRPNLQIPLPDLNPLFAHHAALDNHGIGFIDEGIRYYMTSPQRILVPNPIHTIPEKGYGNWHLGISIQDLDPALAEDSSTSPSTEDGSWKAMYLSNPPCDIHVKVWKTNKGGYSGMVGKGPLRLLADYKGTFVVNGGTFNDILQQAAALRNSSSTFWI